MEKKQSFGAKIWNFTGKIHHGAIKLSAMCTVEIYALLLFLGLQMYTNLLSPGLYQNCCAQFNRGLEIGSQVDCYHPKSISIRDQNRIQRALSNWAIVMALSHFLPSMFTTCMLGAWGDLHGRKPNLLLALAGVVVSTAATPFFFYFSTWSLWFLALINFLGGCLGYVVILTISAYAYLCDTMLDKDVLSIRLASFSACMSVASILGSLLSGALLGRISLAWICLITTLVLAAAFFFVFWRLEDLTPKEIRLKLLSEQHQSIHGPKQKESLKSHEALHKPPPPPIDSNTTQTAQKATFCQKFQKTLHDACGLLKEIYHTYAKPRRGHERSILVITSLVLYLYLMADLGLMQSIMNHYVFRHPFYWTTGSELGYWKAAKGLILLFGNIFGMLLFKRYLKLRDTTIMLIASASCACELIFIAFSTTGWMLYLALFLGCFTNLLMPVLGTLISRIVGYDEIGKAFTAHGLASNFAFLTSALIFNGVYKATLNFMPGFVFLFGAGIIIFCFGIIVWIHVTEAKYYNVAIGGEDGAGVAKESFTME